MCACNFCFVAIGVWSELFVSQSCGGSDGYGVWMRMDDVACGLLGSMQVADEDRIDRVGAESFCQ